MTAFFLTMIFCHINKVSERNNNYNSSSFFGSEEWDSSKLRQRFWWRKTSKLIVTKNAALECIDEIRSYVSVLNDTTHDDYNMLYSSEKNNWISENFHQTKIDVSLCKPVNNVYALTCTMKYYLIYLLTYLLTILS